MALKLEKISLLSSRFEVKPGAAESKYQLALTNYRHKSRRVDDGFGVDIILDFDLFGQDQKEIKFKCRWILSYSGAKEDKTLLKEHIVVAHAIPYLREYAANTLMRAGFRQNLLDPTNAFHLWKAYQEASQTPKA